MYFTREPIIETIISAREGHKILVRHHRSNDEYLLDAVEIVSFGRAILLRSLEGSKPFLLHIEQYTISEVKETKLTLKHASSEKSGGNNSTKSNHLAQSSYKKESSEDDLVIKNKKSSNDNERRRDKRRSKRRKNLENAAESLEGSASSGQSFSKEPSEGGEEERKEAPAFKLIPPPSRLISETLQQYRQPTDGFVSETNDES